MADLTNLTTEINKLISTKNDLKTVANENGGAITNDTPFSGYSGVFDNLYKDIDKSLNEIIGEEKVYSFGMLSDIHLQDTTYAEDTKNSLVKYERALKFLKDKTALVVVAGDICALNRESTDTTGTAPSEWLAEINLFKQYNEQHYGKPVYACTGNHDANPYGRYEGEGEKLELIRNEANGVGLSQIISNYGDGTKTAETVWEEVLGNPINFVLNYNDDVFIFLSMRWWYYSKFCKKADTGWKDTADGTGWLEQQLELYKDKRVFLITHLPIKGTFDPSNSNSTGANVAENGYQSNFAFGRAVSQYNNVIYFSGHTHYDLTLPLSDTNFINYYQSGNSSHQVHCSAGAYTREPIYNDGEYSSYSNNDDGSQGYIVDVYPSKIVIKALDFSEETVIYLEQIQYTLET